MYDEPLMKVLDQTDDLADQIRQSDLFITYQKAKQEAYQSMSKSMRERRCLKR
ncbi:hypothetical protein ACEUWW_09605 [Staphylococcus pseudintermedius]